MSAAIDTSAIFNIMTQTKTRKRTISEEQRIRDNIRRRDAKREYRLKHPIIPKSVLEKFLERVSPEPNTGCWLWFGGSNNAGYGQFYFEKYKRMKATHAALLFLKRIVVPPEKLVCHHCDTPACVNPDHLFVGSVIENALDAKQKGRLAFGAKHGNAKLTPEAVRDIRNSGEADSVLARRWGISRNNVSTVRTNRTWRHVQ